MGSSVEAVLTPSARVVSHFLKLGKSAKNPVPRLIQSFKTTSWIVRRRG